MKTREQEDYARKCLEAAAPDLLAACKRAYVEVQVQMNALWNTSAPDRIMASWRELFAELQDAIAAAEGK